MSINLLPWRSKQNEKRQLQLLCIAVIGLLLTIVVLAVYRKHLLVKRTYQLEIDQVMQLEKKIKKEIKTFASIKQENERNIKLLKILPKLVPSEVELSQLTDKEDLFVLKGEASSERALTKLAQQVTSYIKPKSFKFERLKSNKTIPGIEFNLKLNP